MALLEATPAAITWQPRLTGLVPSGSTGEARSLLSRGTLGYVPVAVPAAPAEPLSFRCRVGLHRWTSLALSLAGAHDQAAISFCRDCPAFRPAGAHQVTPGARRAPLR